MLNVLLNENKFRKAVCLGSATAVHEDTPHLKFKFAIHGTTRMIEKDFSQKTQENPTTCDWDKKTG